MKGKVIIKLMVTKLRLFNRMDACKNKTQACTNNMIDIEGIGCTNLTMWTVEGNMVHFNLSPIIL